jgi:CelD/BcsL family acetyltransferase involved in cellulose biosynthesis
MTKVALVPLEDVGDAELGAWSGLASRALEPNPFFEPAMMLSAFRLLPHDSGLALLVVSSGARWQACMPVVPVTRWRGSPFSALSTWRHDYSFLSTPLLDREAASDAADALVAFLRRGAKRWRFLVLDWVGEGAALEHIEAAARARRVPFVRFNSFSRAFLRRRDDGDYLAALGKETRRRLGQRRRALERKVGAPRVVERAGGDREAVELFLALEASGWKGQEGTALLSRPEDAEFFRELCDAFARDDRLEVRELDVDEKVLAMSCRIRAGEGTFCFKVAYDEEYKSYAPGNQLEIDNLEYFHECHGSSWVDSCADPGNDFFNRLFPDRRTLSTVVIACGGLRGTAVVRALQLARRLRRGFRRGS